MRVGSINAVNLGGLENNLCTNFRAAQGRCRVGGEERVARSGRKNDNLALFEVLEGLGEDLGLYDLLDGNG